MSLTALHQLSGLLRYALVASGREWVNLGEELDFVHDYLILQRLRYGDRVRGEIQGDEDDARASERPPLLLQPSSRTPFVTTLNAMKRRATSG